MDQSASEQITIDATPDEVFDVIVDVEAYPQWAEGVRSVDLLESGEDGLPRRARFTVDARVMEVTYTLDYDIQRPDRVAWELSEGEQITRLDGAYVLEAVEAGTRVRYDLVVDVDLPLPGFLKKRAAKVILDTGLKGLKRRAEGG